MPRRVISFDSPWRDRPSAEAAWARRPPERASVARTKRASNARRASASVTAAPSARAPAPMIAAGSRDGATRPRGGACTASAASVF